MAIEQIQTQTQENPPRSRLNERLKVFSEAFVRMRGKKYYLRVFYDGSCEFVRYDAPAKKWVYLCFPPDAEKVAEVSA